MKRYEKADTTKFQSTLPRRERPSHALYAVPSDGFNPRSHVGSDDMGFCRATGRSEFQSTLPRRERLGMVAPVSKV